MFSAVGSGLSVHGQMLTESGSRRMMITSTTPAHFREDRRGSRRRGPARIGATQTSTRLLAWSSLASLCWAGRLTDGGKKLIRLFADCQRLRHEGALGAWRVSVANEASQSMPCCFVECESKSARKRLISPLSEGCERAPVFDWSRPSRLDLLVILGHAFHHHPHCNDGARLLQLHPD